MTSRRTPSSPETTDYPPDEIARRRDETIKRMIATPPTPQQNLPKKRPKVKRQKAKT